MNPDHTERALAALARFDSDERRASRTRYACHTMLQQQRRSFMRATAPIGRRIMRPLAVIGSFAFLVVVIAQAIRIESLNPW